MANKKKINKWALFAYDSTGEMQTQLFIGIVLGKDVEYIKGARNAFFRKMSKGDEETEMAFHRVYDKFVLVPIEDTINEGISLSTYKFIPVN